MTEFDSRWGRRFRPIGGTDTDSAHWMSPLLGLGDTPMTRRAVLASPLALAALTLMPTGAMGRTSRTEEHLRFTINDSRTEVGVWLWNRSLPASDEPTAPAEKKGPQPDADATPEELDVTDPDDAIGIPSWLLKAEAFGHSAEFRLYPAAAARASDVSDLQVVLRVVNASFGRNRNGTLDFVFDKRLNDPNPHWTISVRTDLWMSRRRTAPSSIPLTTGMVLGASEGGGPVRLAAFANGSVPLAGTADGVGLGRTLGMTFNGLVEVVVKPATSSAGAVGSSRVLMSNRGGWSFFDSNSINIHPVLPELGCRCLVVSHAVDTRRQEDERGGVEVIGKPYGLVPAGMPRATDESSPSVDVPHSQETEGRRDDEHGDISDGNGVRPLPEVQGSIDGLHFHLHDDKDSGFTSLNLSGMAGDVSCLLHVSPVATESGSSAALASMHTVAVLAGSWNLSLTRGHLGEGSMGCGPFKAIDGVLRRSIVAKPGVRAPGNEIDEQTSFAGAARSDRALQKIVSPIGPLSLRGLAPGPAIGARKGDGADINPFLDDALDVHQGHPIWITSKGRAFDTGHDHRRDIHWVEMHWLLVESALALPDASSSQLRFAPTDLVLFFQRDATSSLPRNYVWLGGNRALQADGPDTADPGRTASIARARIDLSRARLKASRHRDLLSLTFGFDKLFVVVDEKPRLLPEGPLCGIHELQVPPHGPLHDGTVHSAEPSTAATGEGPAEIDAREPKPSRLRETRDSRPLLVVEFPPQHIMERAFFQRAPAPSPDVDLSRVDVEKLKPILRYRDDGKGRLDIVNLARKPDPADGLGRDSPQRADDGRGGDPESCEGAVVDRHVDIRSPDEIVTALLSLGTPKKRKQLREWICAKKSFIPPDVKIDAGSPAGEEAGTEPERLKGQVKTFKEYADVFDKEMGNAALPEDQRVYIGPFGMAPDAAALNHKLLEDGDKDRMTAILADTFREVNAQLELLRDRVTGDRKPDDRNTTTRDRLVDEAMRRRIKRPPESTRSSLLPIETYLESQIPTYQLFRAYYREQRLEEATTADETPSVEAVEFVFLDLKVPTGESDDWLLKEDSYEIPYSVPPTAAGSDEKDREIGKLVTTLTRFTKELKGGEEYEPVTDGRLSGHSRLSFRVNCRDALIDARNLEHTRTSPKPESGTRDYRPDPPHGHGIDEIPFTLSGLTDWSSMELSVISRAETVFAPAPGGRLDQASGRSLNLHGAAALDHLGFLPDADPESRRWHFRAGKIVESLRESPSWSQTAIEVPARLTLSPSQQAIFSAPLGINAAIFESDLERRRVELDRFGQPRTRAKPADPTDAGDRTFERLWSATLDTRENAQAPGLRAVYSPDASPDAILKVFGETQRLGGKRLPGFASPDPMLKVFGETQRQGGKRLPGFAAPPRGPHAPWLLGRDVTSRVDMTPGEFAAAIPTDIVDDDAREALDEALKPPDGGGSKLPDNGRSRAQSEAVCERDESGRWKLGRVLPSMFKDLCLRWQRRELGVKARQFRTSLDAFDRHELVLLTSAYGLPVMPRRVSPGATESTRQASQFVPDDEYLVSDVMPQQEIYRPRALDVHELTLTSLGASFSHDTSFIPPASAKYLDGRNLFDALSIERWQHAISLGRDIHCEVVYKGFLCPFGFKASLVKVTERVFASHPDTGTKAYLRQRMFIRCADREKRFSAVGQPYGGRRFPGRFAKLLTETTPDLVDPTGIFVDRRVEGTPPVQEHANGRLVLRSEPGLVFWPRTALARKADVRFDLEIEEAFSTCPLIFVDNVAANSPSTLALLAGYYNDEGRFEKGEERFDGVANPDEQEPVGDALGHIDPSEHRRTLLLGFRKIRYADEQRTGSASLDTEAITLRMEGRNDSIERKVEPTQGRSIPKYAFDNDRFVFDGTLQGVDQPPFYPALETTRIRLSQNARLTGRPARSVRACYDANYIARGFGENGGGTPQEIYLDLLDAVVQDMGDNGDASGGVFRPNGSLAAISRAKGPIAFDSPPPDFGYLRDGCLPALSERLIVRGPTPLATAGTGDRTSRRSARFAGADDGKEVLTKIMGDAKLLSIISFSDIIDTLEYVGEEMVPELTETVEYGLASVAEAAGDALDLIRAEVLDPLATHMQDVRTRWNRLDAELLERQRVQVPERLGRALAPIGIAELFPELDRSIDEFTAALRTASRESDDGRLPSRLNAVYESGRRFLDAIGKSIANPVERFEQALQQRFGAFKNVIEEAVGILEDGLDGLLDTLKEKLANNLFEAIYPNAGDVRSDEPLFSLPLPGSVAFELADIAIRADTDPNVKERLRKALMVSNEDLRKLVKSLITSTIDGGLGKDDLKSTVRDLYVGKVADVRKALAGTTFESLGDRVEVEFRISSTVLTSVLDELPDIDSIGDDIESVVRKIAEEAEAELLTLVEHLIDEGLIHATHTIEQYRGHLDLLAQEVTRALETFRQVREDWEALEEAVRGGRFVQGYEKATALLSNALGQDVTLGSVLDEIVAPLTDIVLLSLEVIDLSHLGLVTLISPLEENETWTFDPEKIDALEVIPPKRFERSQAGANDASLALIENLAAAHAGVVSLHGRVEGVEEDIEEFLAEPKVQAQLSLEVRRDIEAFPDAIKRSLGHAHAGIAGLYYDIVTDASALAGLDKRFANLATHIRDHEKAGRGGKEAENLSRAFESAGNLRSELKRLLSARKHALERLAERTEIFFRSIDGILLAAGGKAPAAAVALTLVDADLDGALSRTQARIGQAIADACHAALRISRDLAIGIHATIESIEGFLRALVGADHGEALAAVFIHDSIEEALQAIGKLKTPYDPGGPLRKSLDDILDLHSESMGLKKQREYFEALEETDVAALLEPLLAFDFWGFGDYLDVTQAAERAVKAVRTNLESGLKAAADEIVKGALTVTGLPAIYETLWNSRRNLARELTGGGGEVATIVRNLLSVELETENVRRTIPSPAGGEVVYTRPSGLDDLTLDNDRLRGDVAWLAKASVAPISDPDSRRYLAVFFREWETGRSSPALIVRNLVEQVRSLLRGDVDLLELFEVRQQIEAHIRNLVPTRYRHDFKLDFPLPPSVKDATFGILVPGVDCKLVVGAETVVDLLPKGSLDADGSPGPTLEAKALATLGSFDIKLVGEFFDALTLKFSGARFTSDLGSDSTFELGYEDVVIGPQLEFIEDLQSFMVPDDGSGAFVVPLKREVGIEAGYSLSLGTIMLGNATFSNISLTASAELPFGKEGEALFKSSLSRRDAPFLISYAPYGGAGFMSIIANAKGIVGFEMALEFGAAAAFQIGPLNGVGRLMAGFYIKQIKLNDNRTVSELSATFYAGGSASLWIFNFSTSLYVRLGQRSGGSMEGQAVFTFSFSMGLVDFDFTVVFEKREGKGMTGGGGDQGDTDGAADFLSIDHDDSWGVNARAPDPTRAPGPRIVSTAVCQSQSWDTYRSYFDRSIDFDI